MRIASCVRSVGALLVCTFLLVLLQVGPTAAQSGIEAQSRFFVTSDGVRLHYLEAGPRAGHTVVFIPGWTMPAWIWGPQIQALAQHYHVVAFDPRGQGDSEVPSSGYEPGRRGQDIAELIANLTPVPALLVGWSLGVLDTLAYVHTHGDLKVAGLVLVDNSVGEEPPPPPGVRRHATPVLPRAVAMHRFVIGMFRHRQSDAYLDRLTEATLRTPERASRALLAYPLPRSYWRDALYSTEKPVLYVVRPGWLSEQAANLARNRPGTQIAVFGDAGHALFVDDAARFNALLAGFMARTVWP
jgi:non-heme chloroperoxidase